MKIGEEQSLIMSSTMRQYTGWWIGIMSTQPRIRSQRGESSRKPTQGPFFSCGDGGKDARTEKSERARRMPNELWTRADNREKQEGLLQTLGANPFNQTSITIVVKEVSR